MKKTTRDLAILGGAPAFAEPLHVGRPNVPDRERFLERVNRILDAKWLTNQGPYTMELERRIAHVIGVEHCVATSSGTKALELAARALDLRGEVLVPSFTFVATAHALRWQEITPVFCDIDPYSYTIDPDDVEAKITARTTGILGVHLWGRACAIGALESVASRHQLKLLFDASQAFYCSHKGQLLGRFGDAEVFSFHATKVVNSFEGGAVVTNDDELAAKLRLMRNYGFVGPDEVACLGTNAKMSEVSAAMALSCLDGLDALIVANQRNYQTYCQGLRQTPGVRVLPFALGEQYNYHYVVIEIDESVTNISRDEIMNTLRAENVLVRRYFYPGCHNMEPYRSELLGKISVLPNTDKAAQRVLVLPVSGGIGDQQVNAVCSLIDFIARNGSQIREIRGDDAAAAVNQSACVV